MISSGAFPNVALRKPPMPGPGVVRGVLGRLADQPGERDERQRREHEERDVARIREAVHEHGERAEGEQRVEDLAKHGAGTLLT